MTTPSTLAAALAADRRALEARLRFLLRAEGGTPPRLRAAMAHSLLAGGKRLRPLLLLWCHDACSSRRRQAGHSSRAGAMDAACALEMIHTYSLIHDDLPAMDDDALRRGRPTCHVVFGEATAILAGDALQALAFGVLARLGPAGCAAAATIARAAGPAGMAGGQQLDLEAQQKPASARVVRAIQAGKTAALIGAALGAGAQMAGGSPDRVAAIHRAGLRLGAAFQQADDLLDRSGDPARLGKGARKDAAAGKATWIAIEGEIAARRRLAREGMAGCRMLAAALPPGPAAERLTQLARALWERDR